MKKHIKKLGLFFVGVSLMLQTTVFAGGISVTLNGVQIPFDVEPQIIDSRTMVPLRAIFEALGATVEWDSDTQTVSAFRDNTTVAATIGSKIIYINDEEIMMDTTPVVINDRTLVPARFVAEAFECDVDWDADTQTVIITQEDDEEFYEDLGEQGED